MRSLPASTRRPATVAVPALSGSCPSSTLSSDVLPVPLGPSTATNSPARTVRSSWSYSTRSPNASRAPVSSATTSSTTKENLSARLRCLVQLARQLVDGLALPGQVIGARRERLCDIDDGHRRLLGGVLKLFGDLGLGLGVVDQRRHLVGVDQVEHGGQIGGRRVAVLFDRF